MTEIFVVFPLMVLLIIGSKWLACDSDQPEEDAEEPCWDCWEDRINCRCGGGEGGGA